MIKYGNIEKALREGLTMNEEGVIKNIKKYNPSILKKNYGILPNEEFKNAKIGCHHIMPEGKGLLGFDIKMKPDEYDIRDFLLYELWKARGFSKDASDDEIIDWATDLENRAKDSEIEDMIREGEFKEAANFMAEYIPGISVKLDRFTNTEFPAMGAQFKVRQIVPLHKILNNKEGIDYGKSDSEE
jgi:hypothetical protein